MIHDLGETICAPATPLGGGIAVIRISGEQAPQLALQLLGTQLTPRHTTTASLRIEGRLIDLVVATYFAAPHSYTGEEVVEISCHASPYIVSTVLSWIARQKGCRMADPGEFTRRALAHGKLDLAEAEAVADLIAATTASQHKMAMQQHTGRLSELLNQLRETLLRFAGLLELELDFSEEDVTFADRTTLTETLVTIQQQLRMLTQSFATGQELQQGIPTAIIGAPNVGKSSLLNALLQHERAIVSDIPGTTRDTVEGRITIGGQLFRLVDTAGLRQTTDQIEQLGIERSYQQISSARIILWLLAPPLPAWHEIETQLQQIKTHASEGSTLILLLNKRDLLTDEETSLWLQACANHLACEESKLHCTTPLAISAKASQGIEALEELMVTTCQTAQSYLQHEEDSILLYNLRHYEALTSAEQALACVSEGLAEGLTSDLLTPHLREAIEQIGLVTGATITSDEVLGYIFSHFCIGK